MNFNPHYELKGKHSFLSASGYHWIRYDKEKLIKRFHTSMDAQRGTELHELAYNLIRLGIKLPKTTQTLNMYVNDAIGLHMSPEVTLYLSRNAFCTADALSFGPSREDTSRNLLRVHDLKNGVSKASMDQLRIYAAYFCIEYGHMPHQIDMELRIYQNDEREIYIPDPDEIVAIMNTLLEYDQVIEDLRNGVTA